jgi:hypothetical protein
MIEINATIIVKLEKIDYRATKEVPIVFYYKDGSGDPGSPAECDIEAIWIKLKDRKGNEIEVDISEYVDTEKVGDAILEELSEQNDREL